MKRFLTQFSLLGELGAITIVNAKDKSTLIEHLNTTKQVLVDNVSESVHYHYIDITDEDITLKGCAEITINDKHPIGA